LIFRKFNTQIYIKQNPRLEAQLDRASTAQERVIALNALVEELRDTATQRGLALAQSAFELAQTNHDQAGMAHRLVNLGYCHFRLGQVENAQTEAVTALQLFEEIQDRRGQVAALLQIGVLYWRMADLTVSVGLASFPEHGANSDKCWSRLIKRFIWRRFQDAIG
jgi:tetratricopeptide (TPR) repeat protein